MKTIRLIIAALIAGAEIEKAPLPKGIHGMHHLQTCCKRDGERKVEERERQKGRDTVKPAEEMKERRRGETRKCGGGGGGEK